MQKECDIRISPQLIIDDAAIKKIAARKIGVSVNRIQHMKFIRRSIDARKTKTVYVLKLKLWIDEAYIPESPWQIPLQNVENAPEAMVVGLGPAGLFAGLRLIELGYKPVIIERGKDVRARRRDLAKLNREGLVNPESNYCFGEGGAGTYSDGKLYTRSFKRGKVNRILDIFIQFGAKSDIRVDARPHIGTNKLPKIIANMREQILECGGEILFNTKLTDIILEGDRIKAVELNHSITRKTKTLILATGHSARDIFTLLYKRNILIEAKPFALGVRVEHPQGIIDRIQYKCSTERHPNLPAASYSVVKQIIGRGVYSFCMCPGGIICPATTDPNELVVNGWSPSRRNSKYANSGIVVELPVEDFKGKGVLAGMHYQSRVEKRAFKAGGGKQLAPAQRLVDFVNRKASSTLPECSYIPGLSSVNMKEVLPTYIHKRLIGGFKTFGKQLKGYLTNEAVVVGVESRTSSPVRIPRDPRSCMHPQVKGLFPCGEGAGYAGGIMSAAIDGEKCATSLALFLANRY